jgi:hypothetical protein
MNTIESYITDEQLIEGAFGSLSWGIFWIYLRDAITLIDYLEAAIAWILVWLVRKFGLSFYLTCKKKYNIMDRYLRIVPYPSIINPKKL